jgi:predicted SAM-dependent methyltransferase
MRLKLDLTGSQSGTTLNWVREFTATDQAGQAWVRAFPEAQHRAMMERLEKMLKHYLATGALLRLQAAEAHSEQ